MKKIYLDNAATTRVDPEVFKAMQPYFSDFYGNPSSVHSFGHEAKKALESARLIAAGFINSDPQEIIFTGSGTESDNMAIKGIAFANHEKGNHIITSAIEHHAVLESCHSLEKSGFEVSYVPADPDGIVNLKELKKAIKKSTVLISVMHANNEIGTIQPVSEIGQIARSNNIYFHIDAVQTFGHLKIDVEDIGADLLSASAHKLYGPKGVGLIYVRRGTKINPLINGGSQENNMRASTQNVPGIVGFGKAIELASRNMEKEAILQTKLRDRLIDGVIATIDRSYLNGDRFKRLPNNASFSFDFIEGEGILLGLDMKGIAASSGSACSSGSMEPSHVLKSIGMANQLARGSVRFSLGRFNTREEIAYTLEVLVEIIDKLRKISPLTK
ncbi:MAG: cysteine desulfurase NifS [Actinobacteria bacterium]|nr:cysteine desulfurase NifS [Actinomycetota bacterium]